MKKLIHYQILPAEGYVSIWNCEDNYLHPDCGIALENQKRNIALVRYIFTGLYNDGSIVSRGLLDISSESLTDASEGDSFKYLVTFICKRMAKALIEGEMYENRQSQREAKEYILSVIKESRVGCEHGVIEMLSDDIQPQQSA